MLHLEAFQKVAFELSQFQRAPTLGGECYFEYNVLVCDTDDGFNGHPPLGVNATV